MALASSTTVDLSPLIPFDTASSAGATCRAASQVQLPQRAAAGAPASERIGTERAVNGLRKVDQPRGGAR
jgi:hypothetical protein